MANFQVPQFIDTEDKIVGPLTIKQFGFIAAAFLITIGLFYILEFFFWVILTVFIWALALGLSFAKVSGRTMLEYLISAFTYYWQPHVYLWQHEIPAPIKTEVPIIKEIKIRDSKGIFKTKRLVIPQIKINQPTITVTQKPHLAPSQITTGSGLENLSAKLMTTKSAIPKREKPFLWWRRGGDQQFATVLKSTGERISAKRVDYR